MSSSDCDGILKQPTKLLLKNGNLMGFFLLPEMGQVSVQNTCSFDAVAQILTVGYIDHPKFREIVDSKKDGAPSLDVVVSLATKGACKDVYQLRAKALVPVSSLLQARNVLNNTRRAQTRRSINILEYSLAILGHEIENQQESRLPNGNVAALVEALFSDLPSKVTSWECPNGHDEITVNTLITVNYDHLRNTGIQGLKDNLEFSLVPEDMECAKNNCQLDAHGTSSCSNSVFVDLGTCTQTYKLSDVPVMLVLRGSKFTLVGIVAYTKEHFIAYCRRRSGVWEKFDDCNKNSYSVTSKETLVPHLIFYLKTE